MLTPNAETAPSVDVGASTHVFIQRCECGCGGIEAFRVVDEDYAASPIYQEMTAPNLMTVREAQEIPFGCQAKRMFAALLNERDQLKALLEEQSAEFKRLAGMTGDPVKPVIVAEAVGMIRRALRDRLQALVPDGDGGHLPHVPRATERRGDFAAEGRCRRCDALQAVAVTTTRTAALQRAGGFLAEGLWSQVRVLKEDEPVPICGPCECGGGDR